MAEDPAAIELRMTVNGTGLQLRVAPWVTLLDLLRTHLKATGSKKGCDHGQCGACTVLVDGRRVNSCLILAVSKDGAEVTTVEGLGQEEMLHQLQQAFVDHDAFQCGYCTPGQASPLGVKGVGEIGIVGVPAAVANAVFHATGKRIRRTPITIDKVLFG